MRLLFAAGDEPQTNPDAIGRFAVHPMLQIPRHLEATGRSGLARDRLDSRFHHRIFKTITGHGINHKKQAISCQSIQAHQDRT